MRGRCELRGVELVDEVEVAAVEDLVDEALHDCLVSFGGVGHRLGFLSKGGGPAARCVHDQADAQEADDGAGEVVAVGAEAVEEDALGVLAGEVGHAVDG
jgi:hypothetical protein